MLAAIILAPLVGAIVLGLFGKRMGERLIGLIACSTVAVSAILSFYVFFMNRRISRELVTHSWREPTTILSAANGRSREVMRVYGSGWRVTPPVLIDKLPRHVADAFLAAEDVRFRRHIGVDPIGIARALFVNIRAGGVAQGGSTIPQREAPR